MRTKSPPPAVRGRHTKRALMGATLNENAITANHPGHCNTCGRHWRKGARITKVNGNWVHDTCTATTLINSVPPTIRERRTLQP